jgi:deazaflavin-dependent oxidoreductase (nitroreductase family)
MVRRVVVLVGVLLAAVGAWLGFVILAMRTKSPRMLLQVRRFNREFTNKAQRRLAGKPGAYASVIHHRGRKSGRPYETPVVPFAIDDGYLISLPYGTNTDWLANLRASGSATLVTEGETYTIDQPEVVATHTVRSLSPPSEQRTHRIFGVDQCVRVRRVEATAAGRLTSS